MKQQFSILFGATIIIVFFAFFIMHFTQKEELVGSGTAQEITLEEVKIRNNPINCWIIIGSKVYSLTTYIASHPNETKYSNLCGTNATQQLIPDAPSTQSAKILEDLQAYYIGIITP